MTPGFSSVKEYVDQGTQTDSAPQAQLEAGPPINLSVASLVIDPGKHDTPPLNSSVLTEEPDRQFPNAYSHSNHCPPVPNPAQSVTRSVNKHWRIPYNRPSFFNGQGMRIISLPETIPKVEATILDECTPRVASMTERPKPVMPPSASSHHFGECPTDTSFLSDTIYNDYRNCSGAPTTPSPPSSPESILIIGNEPQVPTTFLRHTPTTGACLDGDGWASSPPRPIPALHGPLSLPYARCPSGAEGTLIERDDLPNMIWGLNIYENQPKSSGGIAHLSSQHRRTPSHRPTPAQRLKSQHHSNLNVPFDDVLVPRGGIKRSLEYNKAPNKTTLDLRRAPDWNMDVVNYESSDWNPATGPCNENPSGWYGGLAINLEREHTIAGLPTHNSDIVDNLGTSAPVFIPENQHQNLPRIFIGPHRDHITHGQHTSHRKSRVVYSEVNSLPTPPNTAPPQWTPSFSHNSFQSANILQDITPPTPFLKNDSSLSLHNTFDIHDLEPEYTLAYPTQAPHTIPQTHSSASAPIEILHEACSPYLVSPPNTPLLQIPEKFDVTRNQSANPKTPPLPLMNRTRSLSHQHPRSIPLARLIQRRLSSVPEEDMRSSTDTPRLRNLPPKQLVNEAPTIDPKKTPISITVSTGSWTARSPDNAGKRANAKRGFSNLYNRGTSNQPNPGRNQQSECPKEERPQNKRSRHPRNKNGNIITADDGNLG
ncbi:hypothetical protein BD779DRAFT_1504966 [Infundibulicybe gibba]|nr:hypothetical protein BD779DRAFT_1504966 [Infundibulicybe gibba]